MTVEEFKGKSAVKQFTNRDEEDDEAGLLPHEKFSQSWSEQYRQTWRNARPRSREDIMLDCRFSKGNRQAFGYAYLGSIVYDGGTITLIFAETQVVIDGRNLDRLYDALCQHRVPFIQQGSETEEALKPDDEPHIERIDITNGSEETRNGSEEANR
jgi:hypothetical protein